MREIPSACGQGASKAQRSMQAARISPLARSPEPSIDDEEDGSLLPPCREAFLFASAVAVLGCGYRTKPHLRSMALHPAECAPGSARGARGVACTSLVRALGQLQRVNAA